RDKVAGTIREIQDGKLSLTSADTKLDIPLSRVTQIYFADTSTNSLPRSPWEIRAFLVGGGVVALDLDRWSQQEVTGKSRNFGRLTFHPASFRQVQFNLARSKVGEDDLGTPGSDLWDAAE